MATEAQINANRENAKKSTGPRTPEGKAASSRNSLVHGLCAEKHVLTGEDPDEFLSLCADLRGRFQPEGDGEEKLVMRIAVTQWRLDRSLPLETQIYQRNIERIDSIGPKAGTLDMAFVMDASGHQNLTKLARYETSLERSITRCLRQLADYQKARAQSPSHPVPIRENGFPDPLPPQNDGITERTQINGGIVTPADEASLPPNRGSILPPGVIAKATVETFTPSLAGPLHISISGPFPVENSRLVVRNEAKLDGLLSIHLLDYLPPIGETFTILSAGRITGTFQTIHGGSIDSTRRFQIGYMESEVTLTVIPS